MFDDEEEEYFEGDLTEDIQRFEAFLKGVSIGFLDSDRWEALVDHFLISGSYTKALAAAEEALTQFSFNNTFILRKAQAYSGLGKLKEAIQLLTQIERMGMPSFEMLLSKASVFSQLKDSANAIKYFRAALVEAEPDDRDEIYLDLAVEYENQGKWGAALKVLEEAIKKNPHNEGAIYEIAFCYDQLGEYMKAIDCYSNFIDENPYSFTAWYNLGNAYLKLDDYEQAIWAYDYCVIINDDFGPVYFNLGNAYLSLDKYTKAIESFEKTIELDGDDPMAYCYIGESHEQMGELELAKHYYNRSLELAPLLAEGWLGLGIVEDLEGRTKEGLVLIQKAAELAPENSGVMHVLAGAYEKMEQFELADEYYQLSLALDPDDGECLINYVSLLAKGSLPEALSYLEAFALVNPGNDQVALMKINILWQLGEKDESIALFKICLENDRSYALELFEINPDLKNVPEFVLLGD
ncbi:MAG: tetratricopeptide (TPR) repeat protein [Crocinitomicaceae bacterium]|jgi:tetratricopeptide (TPR) repeat protein